MKKSKSYSNKEEKQKEQILDKENNYNNYIKKDYEENENEMRYKKIKQLLNHPSSSKIIHEETDEYDEDSEIQNSIKKSFINNGKYNSDNKDNKNNSFNEFDSFKNVISDDEKKIEKIQRMKKRNLIK